MLEIKLTKIHKTVELSPNSIYKYTNLVDVDHASKQNVFK